LSGFGEVVRSRVSRKGGEGREVFVLVRDKAETSNVKKVFGKRHCLFGPYALMV